MWEAIAEILTNSNALLVLIFAMIFASILIVLAATGMVRIDTGTFKMGADHRERDIIRQQIEWAHSYIMGLESRIHADNSKFDGYKTKYILEFYLLIITTNLLLLLFNISKPQTRTIYT